VASSTRSDYNEPTGLAKDNEAQIKRAIKETPAAEMGETEAERLERVALLDDLAKKIEDSFMQRAMARKVKEGEWRRSWDLYDNPLANLGGENFQNMESFKADGAANKRRPDINIVRTKCDIAIAQCISMQFGGGEKNWNIFPPANNFDPAVSASCVLMDKEIETQLSASKYGTHASKAMEDRVIFGTGIMKGPVNTGKLTVKYTQGEGAAWYPQTVREVTPTVERVNPWMFYPDHTVNDFAECSDTVELHPMTALELSAFREHDGFDKVAILQILSNEGTRPKAYNDIAFGAIFSAAQANPYLYVNRYQVLEYQGPITYDVITKLGIDPKFASPTAEYYGEVWVCCGKVIRLELEDLTTQYKTPYHVAPWKNDRSSIFGYGHPLLMSDQQRVVTEVWKIILDNASIASGPQVAMYQEYIQPADGSWEMAPRKVWKLLDPSVNIDNAIQWFTPEVVISDLIPIMDMARAFAEEESGTPLFNAGLGSPQNSDTATGSLMMNHNSNVVLDNYSAQWDGYVTEPLIHRYYGWNMMFNVKAEIKGDYIIDVRSSSEYKNKQMYIRDLEKLSVEAASNPAVAMAINQRALLKARFSLMHLPSNEILRTDEEIAAAEAEQAKQPDMKMLELQIKQQEVEVQKARTLIDQAKLKFEATQQQQRELWEHEEKMSANYARLQEAEAMVLRSQNEKETQYLKIASGNDQFLAKLMNNKELAMINQGTQTFLAGMQSQQKAEENLLVEKEMDIKLSEGSGI